MGSQQTTELVPDFNTLGPARNRFKSKSGRTVRIPVCTVPVDRETLIIIKGLRAVSCFLGLYIGHVFNLFGGEALQYSVLTNVDIVEEVCRTRYEYTRGVQTLTLSLELHTDSTI